MGHTIQWGSTRFRLAPPTYAPRDVRVVSLTAQRNQEKDPPEKHSSFLGQAFMFGVMVVYNQVVAEILVHAPSRSIPPPWGSIRFRLAAHHTYAPWGCIVRVVSQTKSRKIPTRNIYILPPCPVTRSTSSAPWTRCLWRTTVLTWTTGASSSSSSASACSGRCRCCTCREPFNSTRMGVDSIAFGSPHVRPMGRTCRRAGELKKNTHPKQSTAFSFSFFGGAGRRSTSCATCPWARPWRWRTWWCWCCCV